MAEIHETIDQLLKERGISGAKMCKDLGMSRSFLTELRKGRAKGITTETAQKLADYFGVSTDYLLGKEETNKTIALLTARINAMTKELTRLERKSRVLYAFQPEKSRRIARMRNMIQLYGREGFVEERTLSDEQMDVLRGILSQMPSQAEEIG